MLEFLRIKSKRHFQFLKVKKTVDSIIFVQRRVKECFDKKHKMIEKIKEGLKKACSERLKKSMKGGRKHHVELLNRVMVRENV